MTIEGEPQRSCAQNAPEYSAQWAKRKHTRAARNGPDQSTRAVFRGTGHHAPAR